MHHPSSLRQANLVLLLVNLLVVLALALVLVNPGAPSASTKLEPASGPVVPSVGDSPAAAPTAAPASTDVASPVGQRVAIPALGVDLLIVEGAGGSQEPPRNLAAHYPNTGNPGLLYAHARPGMFGPLLSGGAVGQQVLVGSLGYRIVSFTRDWPVGQPIPVPARTLVLYTCTSWTYADPKVVAYAEPDESLEAAARRAVGINRPRPFASWSNERLPARLESNPA